MASVFNKFASRAQALAMKSLVAHTVGRVAAIRSSHVPAISGLAMLARCRSTPGRKASGRAHSKVIESFIEPV